MQQLLDGKFPKKLADIFTNPKYGLFPSVSQISFNCTCPDWAKMCKHVAGSLYGVGARLDKDPSLFFTLRGVNMQDLITQAIADKKLSFLEKAKQKSSRVLKDSDLSNLFGIEMEDLQPISITNKQKTKETKKSKAKTNPKKNLSQGI